ncbi:EMP1-trafficking protein [Plasmodium gaboni]|uniref:EMP1-trafficking protein n=1 Tax=Plasmodium gaboni TaxID=647221 RepID=A0A151LW83_9APIC|nr:EMP1-trafficking protein [Plasmodium gaboni]KYO03455.1 EMP1-trafficking protein [Plasmodium gaboni]
MLNKDNRKIHNAHMSRYVVYRKREINDNFFSKSYNLFFSNKKYEYSKDEKEKNIYPLSLKLFMLTIFICILQFSNNNGYIGKHINKNFGNDNEHYFNIRYNRSLAEMKKRINAIRDMINNDSLGTVFKNELPLPENITKGDSEKGDGDLLNGSEYDVNSSNDDNNTKSDGSDKRKSKGINKVKKLLGLSKSCGDKSGKLNLQLQKAFDILEIIIEQTSRALPFILPFIPPFMVYKYGYAKTYVMLYTFNLIHAMFKWAILLRNMLMRNKQRNEALKEQDNNLNIQNP